MADIFISYAREDKDFVRRLDESLKSRGREAWVDWEGIRPTEEFMQAIYGAIEAADTFALVFTLNSIVSVPSDRENRACDELNCLSISVRRIIRTSTDDRMRNKAKTNIYSYAARSRNSAKRIVGGFSADVATWCGTRADPPGG